MHTWVFFISRILLTIYNNKIFCTLFFINHLLDMKLFWKLRCAWYKTVFYPQTKFNFKFYYPHCRNSFLAKVTLLFPGLGQILGGKEASLVPRLCGGAITTLHTKSGETSVTCHLVFSPHMLLLRYFLFLSSCTFHSHRVLCYVYHREVQGNPDTPMPPLGMESFILALHSEFFVNTSRHWTCWYLCTNISPSYFPSCFSID